jgi:hypothetical protein
MKESFYWDADIASEELIDRSVEALGQVRSALSPEETYFYHAIGGLDVVIEAAEELKERLEKRQDEADDAWFEEMCKEPVISRKDTGKKEAQRYDS